MRWAICDDWVNKRLAWKMAIPRGMAVPAAWGSDKFRAKGFDERSKGGAIPLRGGTPGLLDAPADYESIRRFETWLALPEALFEPELPPLILLRPFRFRRAVFLLTFGIASIYQV